MTIAAPNGDMTLADVAKDVAEIGFDYASQPKVDVKECNLCGSETLRPFEVGDKYGQPVVTVMCPICGLVVIAPRMTAAAYKAFYSGPYRQMASIYQQEPITNDRLSRFVTKTDCQLIDALRPGLEAQCGGTLLDIGGSTGTLAGMLREQFGYDATVLDPAAGELSDAIASGLRPIEATLEDWEPSDKRFNVITMLRTIEHLADVTDGLAKIRDAITPGGLFVLTVVDFAKRMASVERDNERPMAINVDHIHNLTIPVAFAYLRRAGFDVRCARNYGSSVAMACVPRKPIPDAMPQPIDTRDWFKQLGIYELVY